jgi:D-glycerate 3-kinase
MAGAPSTNSRDAITQPGYAGVVVDAVLALALDGGGARPWLIGLSGLPGSGKSTLAAQVVDAARRRGSGALAISLDDFYLGRAARAALARTVHPLLRTRGVPGTHDIGLLQHTLAALRRATPQRPAWLPRFDKGRDTRLPPSCWRRVAHAPAWVILEGWCVGVAPQAPAALRLPLNRLEREQDRDGHWRRWVNAQLEQHYVPLWQRIEQLALLQAPAWAIVARWRDEQERSRRRRHAPHALAGPALHDFLMHFERLGRHALRTLPARADLRIVLDARRRVVRLSGPRSESEREI